jgi:hypothetical protein
MLGKFDDARANVELARAAAERNPDNAAIRDGYLGMRARVILETEQWERIALAASAGHENHAAAMPGMNMPGAGGGTWLFIAGFSAAKLGDPAGADAAVAALKALREGTSDAYRAQGIAILENEVAAVAQFARGQRDAGLALARSAADIELAMSTPSGPPEPIKPALELYGELLLAANRPADAVTAFEQSLLRTPKRTPSLLGLGRAAAAAGNAPTARRAYAELTATPGAAAMSPAMTAARAWLAANPE